MRVNLKSLVSKNPPKIWRSVNEYFNDKCVTETVKHGGGSVMVWGCMAASGFGNLVFIESTMKKGDYLSILKQNVTPQCREIRLRRKLDISTG